MNERAVRPQPSGGDCRALAASRVRCAGETDPAVDLALVKPSAAQITEATCLPIHAGQQRDPLGQLITQADGR